MRGSSGWSPLRAYAPHKKLWPWQDLLLMAFLCAAGLWIWTRAATLPQYDWNWKLLTEFVALRGKDGALEAGLLLKGLFTTLRIGFWTLVFSLATGGLLGFICARAKLSVLICCQLYINAIRNIPPLVFLFCIYFFASNMLPFAALEDGLRQLSPQWRSMISAIFAAPGQMDRFCAAVLALGLYQGAYVAEIVRAGIESVPKGQWDAALALGFGNGQCLKLVILPQAARLMLPPLTGQAITTFKDSALASLISLPDLTFQSLEIMAVSNMTFEIWISSAILYLLIGLLCALAGYLLERKYSSYLN